MLSLVSSKDCRLGFSYMDTGIVVMDESNQAESMESLVWCFQKMKWNKVVPWTFHEAFFHRLSVKWKGKKKTTKKSFYILIKINSFDIYFCCFLLSCWAPQTALQNTCTQTHTHTVYFALHCQCYYLMPSWLLIIVLKPFPSITLFLTIKSTDMWGWSVTAHQHTHQPHTHEHFTQKSSNLMLIMMRLLTVKHCDLLD